MNTTRTEQIEKLKQQIMDLEAEEQSESRAEILPLLREHAVCHWNEFGPMSITFDDMEMEKKILKLVEGKEGGFYHFGCKIDPTVSVRFDDGEVTIRFEFCGSCKNIREKSLQKAKELGLKVSFDKIFVEKQKSIDKLNKDIAQLMEAKEIYEKC